MHLELLHEVKHQARWKLALIFESADEVQNFISSVLVGDAFSKLLFVRNYLVYKHL